MDSKTALNGMRVARGSRASTHSLILTSLCGVAKADLFHHNGFQRSRVRGCEEGQCIPLVLLAGVVLLGQVDQVDDRLGSQEQIRVENLNLHQINPVVLPTNCTNTSLIDRQAARCV